MDDNIKKAFDSITAEDALKRETLSRLQKPRRRSSGWKYAAALGAVVLLLFGIYFAPAGYISLDINPSVELTVNMLGRVISAQAYNEDGKLVLSEAQTVNMAYMDAVSRLMAASTEAGYLTDGGLVAITVQADNEQQQSSILAALQGEVATALANSHVEVEIYPIDGDTLQHAHQQQLSPAKYLAILELQQVAPEISFDECRHHSISEIRGIRHAHQYRHGQQDDERHQDKTNNDCQHHGSH